MTDEDIQVIKNTIWHLGENVMDISKKLDEILVDLIDIKNNR